jgi:hypothetical protein
MTFPTAMAFITTALVFVSFRWILDLAETGASQSLPFSPA